jgi:hypothetical protein
MHAARTTETRRRRHRARSGASRGSSRAASSPIVVFYKIRTHTSNRRGRALATGQPCHGQTR